MKCFTIFVKVNHRVTLYCFFNNLQILKLAFQSYNTCSFCKLSEKLTDNTLQNHDLEQFM